MNDKIAYYKSIGLSAEDMSVILNISIENVWLYYRLINVRLLSIDY